MYQVVKRIGSFFEKLEGAPSFSDRKKAEEWALDYIEKNPSRFKRGLEAIGVRKTRQGSLEPQFAI